MNERIIIYFAHKNLFTAHGFGDKEADSFIPAHRKKHNKFNTHTYTVARTQALTHARTHTHSRVKWEAELQATKKEVRLDRRSERMNVCVRVRVALVRDPLSHGGHGN